MAIKQILKQIVTKTKSIPSLIISLCFHSIYCVLFTKPRNSSRKLIINSNKNYFKKTTPKLIEQLLNYGIEREEIILMVGGYEKTEKREFLGIKTYLLDNNTIDYTAFIGIIELELTNRIDFFFYLHDTTEINSKKFYNIFYKYPIKKGRSYSIAKNRKGMNIGFYSKETLLFNKEFILKIKNTKPSSKALQNSKSLGVVLEDAIFNNDLLNKRIFFIYSNTPISKKSNYLGQARIQEKYNHLGILKYKANFKVSNEYVIHV